MPQPDLNVLVPAEAAQAFADGDERLALTLLSRARDLHPALSLEWAVLERLVGLVQIHLQREVEGTFALERADPVLDHLGVERPSLLLLTAPLSVSGSPALESQE